MDHVQRVPDQIWKVCKGSGMGRLHSGDGADLTYNNRAEWGWAACPVIMEMCGIVKIWRFRDDVLVLASERLKSHTFGQGMIDRAGYFITKCKKISHDKIEYLDCEAWIENGTTQSRLFFNQPIWEFLVHTFTSRGPSLSPWRPQHVPQLRGESKGDS